MQLRFAARFAMGQEGKGKRKAPDNMPESGEKGEKCRAKAWGRGHFLRFGLWNCAGAICAGAVRERLALQRGQMIVCKTTGLAQSGKGRQNDQNIGKQDTSMSNHVRLFVDQPLGPGQAVALGPEQANYLFAVMRLPLGAEVLLFNGRDGEWLARVEDAGKKRGALRCEAQSSPQRRPPDLWLIFSPIKKDRTNFIVEKAVELGVAAIVPVQTRFTNSERWRQDKQAAHAIEAAEQCGATFVPEVHDIRPLDRVLAEWPADRLLFWADETLARQGGDGLGDAAKGAASAILIGPEGGFSDDEKERLRALPFVRPIRLGPRILRAETAAIAALVSWQQACGDWA